MSFYRNYYFKKILKSPPIRPAGYELWSVWMSINRVTLQHNKEFIMFPFYLVFFFWRCVIFKSDWYVPHFELTPARDVHERLKQTAKRWKLQERLLTINKRTIIRWNIYRDNNFYWERKQIGSSVKDRKKLKRVVKPCSWFYACISSLLIEPGLHSEIGSYRRESTFFGHWIKFLLIFFEKLHIYKTIHNI